MRAVASVLATVAGFVWLAAGALGLQGLHILSTVPVTELPTRSPITLEEVSYWAVIGSILMIAVGMTTVIASTMAWAPARKWPLLIAAIVPGLAGIWLGAGYMRNGGPGRALAGLSAVAALFCLAAFWLEKRPILGTPRFTDTDLLWNEQSISLSQIRQVQRVKLMRGSLFAAAAMLLFMPGVTQAVFSDLYPVNRFIGGLTPVDYVSASMSMVEVAGMIGLLCVALFARRPGVRVVLNKQVLDFEVRDRQQQENIVTRIKQVLREGAAT